MELTLKRVNNDNLTTTTLYVLGILDLLLASILLYFVVDPSSIPANGIAVKVIMLLLAGLGGGTGVALIWKSGRITWNADAPPGDEN